jgi:hypothetical protein
MSHARVSVLTLLRQVMLRACSLAFRSEGMRIAISTAIMAMTTNSSIKVKALFLICVLVLVTNMSRQETRKTPT